MSKHLFYRIFKIGKLPKNINRDKLSVFDEGIKIVAKYKDFKSPGKSFKGKTTVLIGSIVISKKRITAFAYSSPIINLKLTDDRLKKIDYSGSTDSILSMCFDVSIFSDNSSGIVTYLFHTPKAKEFLGNINA